MRGRRHEIEVVEVRTGGESVALTREEFRTRFRARFADPAFEPLAGALDTIEDAAWEAYTAGRKSPRTRPAGEGFADPTQDLSVDWLAARAAIHRARLIHADRDLPTRVLVVAGAARSDQTCPGEVSKTSRLVAAASDELRRLGCDVDLLDLSRLASEYGRVIYPCKGCVSTAMPLCHWPCSCYPNHALGQAGDWMADIYPLWVAAHGILIVTPVYWYQAPSPLKLMMDRLVCADGGNPDPTTTRGKDPRRAKALELAGWSYPRHLAGRAFGVVVHGDTDGAEALRRVLTDWLTDMHLEPAGGAALIDRYIGYYEPYATSHVALDQDEWLFAEVGNVARTLHERAGRLRRHDDRAGRDLADPRPK
jgi:multimeric flavodoxin WrbA